MPSLSANKRSVATTILGLCFITATVSAVISGILYRPLLNDVHFFTYCAGNRNRIVGGAFSEIITCCSNIGTAVLLYPYLRKFNKSVGLAYVCFRFLEVVFIAIGVIAILSLLAVSKSAIGGNVHIGSETVMADTLKSSYGWTFLLGPNFILGLNTFVYTHAFYRISLVPKWLGILGLVGAVLILLAGTLLMFGLIDLSSPQHVLLALPIASFEMILAMRLLTVGFNHRYL